MNNTGSLGLPEGQAVLVASHPRSGTHFIIDFIRRQFPACRGWRWWGLPLDHLYLNIERLVADNRRFSDRLATRILFRSAKPLMKTHAWPDFSDWWIDSEAGLLPSRWREYVSKRKTTVYVYRDPRDVMASYHQFMKGITLSAQCSLLEFMCQPHRQSQYTRLQWWAAHVRAWLQQPGLKIRFEDVLSNPEGTLRSVGFTIDERPGWIQPILPPHIQNNRVSRLYRLLMRSPHSTAIIADSIQWPKEDWRRVLSRSDREYIHEEIGDLLIQLGYESSSIWVG